LDYLFLILLKISYELRHGPKMVNDTPTRTIFSFAVKQVPYENICTRIIVYRNFVFVLSLDFLTRIAQFSSKIFSAVFLKDIVQPKKEGGQKDYQSTRPAFLHNR
jgi:hypothetical protein